MQTYSSGDIVIVPFPFVDSAKTKNRPALVVSTKTFNQSHSHTLLAMITTASHTQWHSDIVLSANQHTGLPVASVIRFKLFTLSNDLIKRKIGNIPNTTKLQVQKAIATMIGSTINN